MRSRPPAPMPMTIAFLRSSRGSPAAAIPTTTALSPASSLGRRPIYAELTALVSVIVIDLVLAGDNAVVVGMAAAGLPRELRKKAIVIGIGAAAPPPTALSLVP